MTLATSAPGLKRWFIAPYVVLNGLGLVYAIVRTVASATGSGHDTAGWAVAAATHLAVLAFGPRSWPHRESGLGGLLVATTAGTVTLVALLPDSLAPLVQVAVVAWLGSLLNVGWYARFGRRPAPALAVGALLPDLRLLTAGGQPFSTTKLRGAPAALFFFRGAWCPFCSAQVKTVVDGYERLARRGVRVAMISPQPEKETRKLAERFGIEILWLCDRGLLAAQQLGIVDRAGVPAGARGFGRDTVLPTLVVLDSDGRVIATDETDTYRVRPDPDTVLRMLDAAADQHVSRSRISVS